LPESAVDQWDTTTEPFDEVQTRESRRDVDGSEDELDEQLVVDARRLEDGGAVVEEVVDAGPLLQELDAEAEERAVDDARLCAAAGEALPPASNAGALLLLDAVVHLAKVVLDQLVVQVVFQAAEARHGQASFFPAVFAGQPAGRFGREENADAEGKGEGDAESDDDSPGCVAVFDLADAVVDQVGYQDADRDHELVRGDDSTSDFTGAALGLEHGDTWVMKVRR